MKIHPAEQGSVDWMLARSGIPTASEFDAILTPEFKPRTGEMPKTYIAKKIAEWWQGGPLASFNTFNMEAGQILEEEARPWYELQFGEEIQRVGLCLTDDERVGCSPDGLIGEDMGIEIKCPEPHTHVRYILAGELPKDYAAQVHGGMFVTGRPLWRFLSYRRHFPSLVLLVERDEAIQAKIRDALETFLGALDEAKARMIEINGGEPPRRSAPASQTPEYSAPLDDVPH